MYAFNGRTIFYNIAKVIYAVLSVLLFYWLITMDEELSFTGWLAVLFAYGIATLCAWGFKDNVGEFLFDVVDIIKAYENNAIEQ